uniref:C2H2-type domain-containing protein n=1 Tax=viral metagenome TaxID=1070528 RepID=A0A6C0EBX2_9ZZZZ
MSVVSALLRDLPPSSKEVIDNFREIIKDAEEQLTRLQQELSLHKESCEKWIQNHWDRMKKFVFELTNDPTPAALNLQEMLQEMQAKRRNLETRIATASHKILTLKTEMAGILNSSKEQIRSAAKVQILKNPMISEVTCPICTCIGPPVTLKFPCYERTNPQTGRPDCSMMVCLRCARNITGLSIDSPYHAVRCHVCRTIYNRFSRADQAYTINMLSMRMTDAYLDSENKEFSNYFGEPLNPIECAQCDMTFAGVSDLHHHMRGDNGFVACPRSLVRCNRCASTVCRSDLNANGSCSRGCARRARNDLSAQRVSFLTDNWEAPAPVAVGDDNW